MRTTVSAANCTTTLECAIKCIREKCDSASTVKNNVGAMNAVIRANPSATSLENALVRDRKETFEALKGICGKPVTLKTRMRITGIMGTFRRCEELQQDDKDGLARRFWGNIHRGMLEDQKLSAQNNTITPRPAQIKNVVPLEEILAAARTLDHWSLKQSQDKVLLTIAALVPAKRADWGCLRIVASIEDVQADENGLVVAPKALCWF